MDWPPKVGELLPRAEEAIGIRPKLAAYSLDPDHPSGGHKARGFEVVLGITIEAIDYLEAEIRAGLLTAPIQSARPNRSRGVNCTVEFPLLGLGRYSARAVILRTIWHYSGKDEAPRLITAFLRP